MVVTLMQIHHKGKLSFCASKRPIIFFSFRLMRNGSNDENKSVCLTFGRPVYCMFSAVLSSPQATGSLGRTSNYKSVVSFSPRGCQRSSIVLAVTFELSPNPHHEHTGHKIKRDPQSNKSSWTNLKIIGSVLLGALHCLVGLFFSLPVIICINICDI